MLSCMSEYDVFTALRLSIAQCRLRRAQRLPSGDQTEELRSLLRRAKLFLHTSPARPRP